jgi:hypothetical protein
VSASLVAGRYRIGGRIGDGGMGIVYRAVQLPLGREVALKVLRPRFVEDPRARARFEREARVASALEHPAAVEIYDFGDDGASVYLAMELLTGRSLRACEPLGLERVLDVVWQVADILDAAHRTGLVHRDLKPENIFLEPDGDRVRIVDFGLAFIASSETAGRMTVEGVVTGTPAYLSPEQARGTEVGPPTDVYALGCVLYELLAGSPPFRGTEMEVLTKHMFVPAPALRPAHVGQAVPAALESLVASMLRKRSEERPSARRVRDAIGTFDPALAAARGRGRDDTSLLGREARMVGTALPQRARGESDAPEVALVGEFDGQLLVALLANGLAAYVVTPEQPVDHAAAVYAPGATVEDVARWRARGMAVITVTEARDMERIGALLRAGAHEVLVLPVRSDELARRIRRAVQKLQRRR